MQYIRIINWKKYQHYKDRRPPWIKLYSKLLRKYEFIKLPDDSKLFLILLWLFASTFEDNNPCIPADPAYLKKQLPINSKINFDHLIKAGFIEITKEVIVEDTCRWASRYVSKDYKEKTLRRFNNKCVKCNGVENLEIDHIVPISQGGTGELNNLQVLCRSCNRSKHAMIDRSKTDDRQMIQKSAPYTETETETETEKKKKKESRFASDSSQIHLANLLFSLMKERNPSYKSPDEQDWAIYIDRLVRLDGKTIVEIEAVIRWAQADQFWHKNILSTRKLRKHYDRLVTAMLGEHNEPTGTNRRNTAFEFDANDPDSVECPG